MKGQDHLVGLLVQHVEGVRRPSSFEVLPIDPDLSFQGCVTGQVQGADGGVPLLSWDAMLLREERVRVAAFQEIADRRLAELADDGP